MTELSRRRPLTAVCLVTVGALVCPSVRAGENNDRKALLAAVRRGNALYQQGKTPEAIAAYRKACAISERLFGPQDLNLVRLLEILAKLYQAEENYPEAIGVYRRILAVREAKQGKDVLEVG